MTLTIQSGSSGCNKYRPLTTVQIACWWSFSFDLACAGAANLCEALRKVGRSEGRRDGLESEERRYD